MTSVTKFVRCNGLVVVSRFGYLQSLFDYEAVDGNANIHSNL